MNILRMQMYDKLINYLIHIIGRIHNLNLTLDTQRPPRTSMHMYTIHFPDKNMGRNMDVRTFG